MDASNQVFLQINSIQYCRQANQIMSQQTLLIRCRQTIQILNELILSHKKDIERLELQNKKYIHQIQSNQTVKTKLLEEISFLKRENTKQRADKKIELQRLQNLLLVANAQIDTQKLMNTSLQKKVFLLQSEISNCEIKERDANDDHENILNQLKQKLKKIEKQNFCLLQQKKSLHEDMQIYKRQVSQLKIECEELNLQIQDGKNKQMKSTSESQKEVNNFQSQYQQHRHVISILEQQRAEHLHVIQRQKLSIQDYKDILERMHYANRSLQTEPAEPSGIKHMSAKKRSRAFQKLVKIQKSIKRSMQQFQFPIS